MSQTLRCLCPVVRSNKERNVAMLGLTGSTLVLWRWRRSRHRRCVYRQGTNAFTLRRAVPIMTKYSKKSRSGTSTHRTNLLESSVVDPWASNCVLPARNIQQFRKTHWTRLPRRSSSCMPKSSSLFAADTFAAPSQEYNWLALVARSVA